MAVPHARLLVLLVFAAAGAPSVSGGGVTVLAQAPHEDTPVVSVIVREQSPGSDRAAAVVHRLGGAVTRSLPIIGGFTARVPADTIHTLAGSSDVAGVWPDGRVEMTDLDDDDLEIPDYDDQPPNSVWQKAIRLLEVSPLADEGDDVTVAVLDTGTTRGPDLEGAVEVRADLTPDGDGADRYGHGTHMAGIIAGDGALSGGRWSGVAPDVDLVSVKVAGWDGATDVSAVLAGLQWIASHKTSHDIRVLNLSFTTDSKSSYSHDPLNFAVERLWQAGIVVIVAAGNRGSGDKTIGKPGDDPYVLTVGAADLRDTSDRSDDVVADFSSVGPTQDGFAKPDLVAPGVTIVAPRAPGSTADSLRPAARVDAHYFKGTGTSQAAAVVSGIAALMLAAQPALTPNEVKAALIGTADPTLSAQRGGGAGLVDASAAVEAALARTYSKRRANRGLTPSTGLGKLNESRGSYRVYSDFDGDGKPDKIDNERNALGLPWTPAGWVALWPQSWLLSPWAQLFWIGEDWEPLESGGARWPGMSVEVETWGTRYWTESTWDTRYWTGKYWATSAWN